MKIESITDEFITIQKTGDQFMQMDAIVDKGELDDSFIVKDINVNRRGAAKDASAVGKDSAKKEDKGKKNKASGSSATKKPSKRRKK